jgi:hypothetical protein
MCLNTAPKTLQCAKTLGEPVHMAELGADSGQHLDRALHADASATKDKMLVTTHEITIANRHYKKRSFLRKYLKDWDPKIAGWTVALNHCVSATTRA